MVLKTLLFLNYPFWDRLTKLSQPLPHTKESALQPGFTLSTVAQGPFCSVTLARPPCRPAPPDRRPRPSRPRLADRSPNGQPEDHPADRDCRHRVSHGVLPHREQHRANRWHVPYRPHVSNRGSSAPPSPSRSAPCSSRSPLLLLGLASFPARGSHQTPGFDHRLASCAQCRRASPRK